MHKRLVLSYSESHWNHLIDLGACWGSVSSQALNPYLMGSNSGARLNVCAEFQADFEFPNTAPTSKSCEMFISRLSLDTGNTQPHYQCLFTA